MQVNKPVDDVTRPEAAQPPRLHASELDPHRIDEIRNRILAGAYQTNEMAEQVARAILRSGDL